MSFTTYNPSTHTLSSLVSAIFTGSSGASVVDGSIVVRSGAPDEEASSISFYDGSISALNIGGGLLLTSGDPTPPVTNTDSSYGEDAGFGSVDSPDADLQNTVDSAFPGAGAVEDVTYLQFQINVTDPAASGLRFEVVFGSDEYPEFSDSDFVDVAGVYVNDVNYALFNSSFSQPLSIINNNLTAGNFRDNTGGTIPIEYDGVSNKLQITAPLQMGLNTIKIAIADTGDSYYDSGIFVSSLQAVNYQGYGLSQQIAVTGTAPIIDTGSNQTYLGNDLGNVIYLTSGQDVFDGGAGIDEAQFQYGLSDITDFSWDGSVLTLHNGDNSATLVNVERVLLGDGTYAALDTGTSGVTFAIYAILHAAFNVDPTTAQLSQWVAVADEEIGQGHDLGDVADLIIGSYAPGFSDESVIAYLYNNIVGTPADAETVSGLAEMVGTEPFGTIGDMVVFGALLSLNTSEIAQIVGSIQLLDHSYFV